MNYLLKETKETENIKFSMMSELLISTMNSQSLQKGYCQWPKQINIPWEGRWSNQLIAIESGWVLFPSSVRKDKIKYLVSRSDISDRKMTFWVAKDTNQVFQGNYLTALSEITHNKKIHKMAAFVMSIQKDTQKNNFSCCVLFPLPLKLL